MQYLNEGSTFFDALLTTSAAGTAAAAAASVHDELAADVTVGSTFDVKSSEQFMMFFFDELTAAPADVDAKMCTTLATGTGGQSIIFEYDGQFTTPFAICASLHDSTGAFKSDALITAHLNTLTGVSNGIVNIRGKTVAGTGRDDSATGTTAKDLFNTHFPWGATATGSAHGMIKVTLPLGLDGSKFRMHLQTLNGKQLGLGSTSLAGQVYVHRARNNNGRTFEVTQAYENKVAGMTHFSKANAATLPVGTFDADVDPIGSAMGSLTIAAFPGAGDATKFNPGTYYNVHITKDNSNNGLGKGIYAKVVVSIGAVTHVEITAGGMQLKPSETYSISCDTRIHSLFTDCDGTAADGTRQDVALKASTTTADVQNVVLPGLRVGATTTTLGGTKAGVCAAGTIQRRYSQADDAAGAAAAATALTAVTVLAGGAPNGAGTVAKI